MYKGRTTLLGAQLKNQSTRSSISSSRNPIFNKPLSLLFKAVINKGRQLCVEIYRNPLS